VPLRPAVTFEIKEIPEEVLAVTGAIRSIRFPVQGQVSDLGLVEAARGSFALKRLRERIAFLDPDADGVPPRLEWAEKEFRPLRVLAPLGLPVPRAHALVRRGSPPDEEAWVVMDALPGAPVYSGEDAPGAWRDLTEKVEGTAWGPAVMRSLGQAVARIHQEPVPAEFAESSRDPFGWRIEWMEGWLREAEGTPGREQDAIALRRRLGSLRSMQAHPPRPMPATLVHGDLNLANVIAVGTEVSGIVDWTGAHRGDPRLDIAHALQFRETARFRLDAPVLAFFEGYGTPPLPADEVVFFQRLGDVLWGEGGE